MFDVSAPVVRRASGGSRLLRRPTTDVTIEVRTVGATDVRRVFVAQVEVAETPEDGLVVPRTVALVPTSVVVGAQLRPEILVGATAVRN